MIFLKNRFTSIICFIILISFNSFAETDNSSADFDSIYYEVATKISVSDIDKAFLIADSLYIHSEAPLLKIRALMLSSSLYQNTGNLPKSVFLAQDAFNDAKKYKEYDWMARISGFLSTQYRLMEMYSEGEKYLNQGKDIIKNVANEEMQSLYAGMISQEEAYYNLDQKRTSEALKHALLAEKYFTQLKGERNKLYFLANNNEFLSRIYIKLKEWDLAFKSISISKDLIQEMGQESSSMEGLVSCTMGKIYLEMDSLDLAYENLKIAEEIAESSKSNALQQSVYLYLSEYYKEVNDLENFSYYTSHYTQAYQEGERLKKKSIKNFINSKKLQEDSLKSNINYLVGVSILLCLILVFSFIFYQRKNRENRRIFNELMLRLEDGTPMIKHVAREDSSEENGESESVDSHDAKLVLPEEVVEEILNKLDQFEKTKSFLKNNISLSKLAVYVGVNNKYLSHVLNTHKNQNFNAYIGELRIRYIIDKLKNDEKYRMYKISFLAEECGYSAHSKFSQSFKTVTGLLPSAFIKQLESKR